MTDRVKGAMVLMIAHFIPLLRENFRAANPAEWDKWKESCCRQAAILGAYLLQTYVLPEYTWTAWFGHFWDEVDGNKVKYEHAWIYGRTKDSRLFVDLEEMRGQILFEEVNGNKYPLHEEWKTMKELQREQLDWKYMILTEKEYYTGKLGFDLAEEIAHQLHLC